MRNWHTAACGLLIFKRHDHHCAMTSLISEWMTDKDWKCIYGTKFYSDDCLTSSSGSCANVQSVFSSKKQTHCLSNRHTTDPCDGGVSCVWDAPCWSAGCSANTPLLLSILVRSCPNDDPRPTFNHYLHCPFNNYSTPLHNCNTRSMRWIPVIVNCLIDTVFCGQAVFFTSSEAYRFYYIHSYPSMNLNMLYHGIVAFFPLFNEVKLRLPFFFCQNVTHSHTYRPAWTLWSKRK